MNPTYSRAAALALTCWLLAGCGGLRDAFLDREVPLAPPEGSALGQAQRQTVLAPLGEPDELDARRFGSQSVEVAYYLDDYSDENQQTQYKFLALEFSQDRLTGYAFYDSGASLPDFSETDHAKLVKSRSTRSDAERVLGAPNGKALLPTTLNLPALDAGLGGAPFPISGVPEGAKEVWQYYRQNFDEAARRRTARQTLSVFFDSKGVYLGDALLHELVTKAP
jgi:hypothetical protein